MICYLWAETGPRIGFDDRVVAHFARHRQRHLLQREAGGQLFARLDGDAVTVEVATGPRRTDRRHRYSYRPDRAAEQAEIDRLFDSGLHYVGDWHTHPERLPHASAKDVATILDLAARSHHSLSGLLLVIVGTAPLPAGLFVGRTQTGLRAVLPLQYQSADAQ